MPEAPVSLFEDDRRISRHDILRWWESRRFSYNLRIGAVGVVTWLLVEIAGSAAVKPGVDFEEPIVMIFGPIFYGIGANLFYTLGWMIDTALYKGQPRRMLYKTGLIFSMILTALPGAWAVIAWLITIYTGKKLD
ncbi:hypothetical protein [Acidicapsa ligni]|uniref:hypothetical protein n=1 Tax=Acidicapsa ligni TaxID=542300 RepID=UPI0021DFA2AD|nr:hypothetical protein [Acidicapsa ligni]